MVDRCDQSKGTICSADDPYQVIRSKEFSICNILTALTTHKDTRSRGLEIFVDDNSGNYRPIPLPLAHVCGVQEQ